MRSGVRSFGASRAPASEHGFLRLMQIFGSCRRGRNSRGLCRGIVLRQACVYGAREKGETINAAAGCHSGSLIHVKPLSSSRLLRASTRSLRTAKDNRAEISVSKVLRFWLDIFEGVEILTRLILRNRNSRWVHLNVSRWNDEKVAIFSQVSSTFK